MNGFSNLPDVWGEGALFAFSAMDGQTHTRSQFVATLVPHPFSLLIHIPYRRFLNCSTAKTNRPIIITSDVIVIDTGADLMLATYASWHTILGVIPDNGKVSLAFEGQEPHNMNNDCQVTWDDANRDAVILCIKDKFWALCYTTSVEQAQERALQSLSAGKPFKVLLSVIEKRLSVYRTLPRLQKPDDDRLFKKSISVMKVNTLSPEGANTGHWSTPDRVPHRHMWLWDSVFHTFGMNHINPELAWNFLKSVLQRQQEGGMIPHMMRVDGTASQITQPPILAWGMWENYRVLKNKYHLAFALPILERYLEWNLTHRDSNRNHLLEWHIEGNPLSRSGESGMDNSQRFDDALDLDAVDFSTFQALDMSYTAEIAMELGAINRAARWRARAETMSSQIHTQLWHTQDGFYYDRRMDGNHTRIKAVSGFLPLLLSDIPLDHARSLVQHLNDPSTFYTSFPIPSVALDTPSWSTDMWRGATWINMNYLVMVGLQQHGLHQQATRLKDKTIQYIRKYYQLYGVIFEFYDAMDTRPPVACDRRGQQQEPYDIRKKWVPSGITIGHLLSSPKCCCRARYCQLCFV